MKVKGRYAIVIGCGRLGAVIAEALSAAGCSVTVVDRDPARFGELSPEFSGFVIEGDATQLSVLEQAKCEDAHIFLAVTGDDNVNLMASQAARRKYRVLKVAASIKNPNLEAMLRRAGIIAVSPVSLTAKNILDAVSARG